MPRPSTFAVFAALAAVFAGHVFAAEADQPQGFRPPSVPLVAHDPYFSIWSPADRLTDAATVHWTGARQSLESMVRIDGKAYRVMGVEPKDVPALPQTGLTVLPTRTIYQFRNDAIQLTLTFTTPALPDDLDVLSRPVTYLTWQVVPVDGKKHSVQIYYAQSAEAAVNTVEQQVVWERQQIGTLLALRLGTKEQPILAKKGDNLRIDWGHMYLVAASARGTCGALGSMDTLRTAFAEGKPLPAEDDARMPRAAREEMPGAAVTLDLGEIESAPSSCRVMVAYDDLYSIVYFKKRLRPYWRRNGAEAEGLLKAAARDYDDLAKRCAVFDARLMADLEKAGGLKYARICALAYRQCIAAGKVAADANGMPLWFTKENFSNGCIGTVDVVYPAAPQLLLLSPALTKGMLVPVLDYAASPRWRFPFAPHDLGTYPMANGQVYGGGERTEENQMPVEESGNMLLVVAALAQAEGNADFAKKYWPVLTQWAEFLKSKGLDPENQLCTDDFAGHLAHNVNLSAKAIVALAAYAKLCGMLGHEEQAAAYRKTAEQFAKRWIEMADDGDHTRLAFDKPGTWSQKYNLVWDRILGLNVFPAEVARREVAYYKKAQNRYGLPLDNRKDYTKLDWTIWTASLSETPEDFQAIVDPIHLFLQATPQRVPMTDWYWTKEPKQVGFQARPVIGGVFIKPLYDAAMWKNWVAAADKVPGQWAPLALPAIPARALVPTAMKSPVPWRYTTVKPASQWFAPDFDDSQWKQGPAGFGTRMTPGGVVRTVWDRQQIWLRREFTLDAAVKKPQLLLHHDEDVEVYVNGVLAAAAQGYTTEYETLEIRPEAIKTLKPGRNWIAVSCRQTDGGQYIDVGIVDE